ncbi:MAG: hypothetical protein KTR30_05445 [Saprospiraceae bacterium]|nr:hypothetical protein [Saprospiraceae bacterium]
MGNEELYDKIEAYLSEQMTSEEKEAFRKEVDNNPDLAAELALHQGMAEAMQEEEELEDLGKKIGAIIRKDKNTSPEISAKRRFSLPVSLRAAAAIALLLIAALAAYFYLRTDATTSTQELYAQFVDYPSSIYEEQILRTEDNPSVQPAIIRLDSLWKKADDGYQAGKNAEALSLLVEIEALEEQVFGQASSRFFYYQGILAAKTGQFSAALASFEQVKTNYTEDAKWKKALILLRLENRREEALAILKEISTASTPRQKDALSLLKLLSSSN